MTRKPINSSTFLGTAVEYHAWHSGRCFHSFIWKELPTRYKRILEDGDRRKLKTTPYPRLEAKPHPGQSESSGTSLSKRFCFFSERRQKKEDEVKLLIINAVTSPPEPSFSSKPAWHKTKNQKMAHLETSRDEAFPCTHLSALAPQPSPLPTKSASTFVRVVCLVLIVVKRGVRQLVRGPCM